MECGIISRLQSEEHSVNCIRYNVSNGGLRTHRHVGQLSSQTDIDAEQFLSCCFHRVRTRARTQHLQHCNRTLILLLLPVSLHCHTSYSLGAFVGYLLETVLPVCLSNSLSYRIRAESSSCTPSVLLRLQFNTSTRKKLVSNLAFRYTIF